ncbi:hypothetical protein POTOM_027603 [Populus tomentosa]|uniref:Uncharacterized protein n=1 Tax=Populus tomentosa TaxID=118781 RepID=A0A8X7ZG14_POPTO|nr:hypothetical protein POTOM_027603 [Populus tomentosa]
MESLQLPPRPVLNLDEKPMNTSAESSSMSDYSLESGKACPMNDTGSLIVITIMINCNLIYVRRRSKRRITGKVEEKEGEDGALGDRQFFSLYSKTNRCEKEERRLVQLKMSENMIIGQANSSSGMVTNDKYVGIQFSGLQDLGFKSAVAACRTEDEEEDGMMQDKAQVVVLGWLIGGGAVALSD